MPSPLSPIPTPTLDAVIGSGLAATRAKASPNAKLHQQAQNFEVAFVNSMFQHMFTGIGTQGPLGNSTGVSASRRFLTQANAQNCVKPGRVGVADQVYKSLLAHQEMRAK